MDDIRTTNRANEQPSVSTSRVDRERSLDALHVLEHHAGSAAPGREREWLAGVRDAITTLECALAIQEDNSVPDEALLSAVERDEPRLSHRVAELRQRFRAVQNEITALSRQIHDIDTTTSTDTIDVTDISQKLERIAGELRYQRARETDLVYEAYAVDLGGGD